MYTWYYTRKEAFKYEVNNKLSMNWLLDLGSNLGIARVPGIGLIYTELPQGVPGIFGHLISNLPAMHSTLILVCIKHLPVPTVPAEERILLRRVGPPAYRMYQCAVRYGYKDDDGRGAELEDELMRRIKEFLRAEAAGALHLEFASNPANEDRRAPEDYQAGGSLVTDAHDKGRKTDHDIEIDSRAHRGSAASHTKRCSLHPWAHKFAVQDGIKFPPEVLY